MIIIMKVMTIDWGSYSAKIFIGTIDKKNIYHHSIKELVFTHSTPPRSTDPSPQAKAGLPEIFSLWQDQLKEIHEFLTQEWDGEMRLIISPPHEFFSYRYKLLPVAQKKKALSMLPFELEDEIPFALQDTLIYSTLFKDKKSMHTLNLFCKKIDFDHFVELMQKEFVIPHYMIHPISLYFQLPQLASWASSLASFCIIDIGHQTTKGYFYFQNKLTNFHITHFGGSRIDEMLMNIYRLNYDQAVKFKHESSFIVPKDLFEKTKLSEDQKFFAENMDLLFSPFLQDLKCWEMIYRVETKEKLGKIFITGGSSGVKNLENYLAYYLERPVEKLADFEGQTKNIRNIQKSFTVFSNGELLSHAQIKPNDHANILGNASLANRGDVLPIYAISFVGVRALALTIMIFIFSLAEYFYLDATQSQMDKTLLLSSNNATLNMGPQDKKLLREAPQLIVTKLQDQLRRQKQNLADFENNNQVNAFKPLNKINSVLANSPCVLQQYSNEASGAGTMTLGSCEKADLEKIITSIKRLDNFSSTLKANNTLNVTF